MVGRPSSTPSGVFLRRDTQGKKLNGLNLYENKRLTGGAYSGYPRGTPGPSLSGFDRVADNLLWEVSANGMKTTQITDSATFRGNEFDSQILRQVLTKVVIQEIPTRLYLSVGDFWTLDIEDATTFDSRSAALEEATNLKLQNVQLVLSRVTKEWEIIPVETRFRRQTAPDEMSAIHCRR
jgi:hypothetical protein